MSDADGGESTLRAALAAARPGCDPVAVDQLGRGNRKRTRRVRFPSAEPVVVQTREPESALRREAALLRAIGERTSVPVPRVLAVGSAAGTGYLVTDHVAGEDLHGRFAGLDRDARRAIARAFGRHLGALHDAFRFRRFGEVACASGAAADHVDSEDRDDLDSADAEVGGPPANLRATGPTDFREWLAGYGTDAIERLPSVFDDLRERARTVLSDPEIDPHPTPRLFPWDLRPGNAVLDGDSVAALFDWERPRASDSALAFAKAEYLVADWYVEEPEPLREAFRRGYESERPLPDVGAEHRVVAVADSAVDSRGAVTNPRFPELDREGAVRFHRRALERALSFAN